MVGKRTDGRGSGSRGTVPWATAQLVFLHVPKTAGTSFTAVLDARFREEEICPAYYWKELFAIPRERLQAYRLVRGHFEYAVTELLRDVRIITMLRDPVARTVSHYRYMATLAHHPLREVFAGVPLPELLEDPEIGRQMVNPQVYYFGRDLDLEVLRRNLAPEGPEIYPWDNRPGQRELSLERARERLATAAFVGLQERFDDSLLLLAETFGWNPPAESTRLNVTPGRSKKDGIPGEWLEAARARNDLDMALYTFATELFEARYRAMVERAAGYHGCLPEEVGRPEIVRYLEARAGGGDA